MDQADHQAALLRLWMVLERLTATRNAKYDDTVRRATFLYGNYKLERDVLSNIRERRNDLVHAGSNFAEMEVCVHQLRRYVEKLILFHLLSGMQFKNIAEAAEFLDLPPDRSDLFRKRRMLLKALRYRTPAKRKKHGKTP